MNIHREPRLAEVRITVPFTPPSVNHYKKPKKGGRGFYVTKAALKFKEAVALLSKGSVDAPSYKVFVTIFLGKGQRGDAGNFEKCIGDGLEDAGIITNDAKIRHYDIKVDRDWKNPRTEIRVTSQESSLDMAHRIAKASQVEVIDLMPAPMLKYPRSSQEIIVRNTTSFPALTVCSKHGVAPCFICYPAPPIKLRLCKLHGAVICRQCQAI